MLFVPHIVLLVKEIGRNKKEHFFPFFEKIQTDAANLVH